MLLFGEEPVRPYERPPLSKTYLRGETGFDDAAVHVADFYASHGIELQTSCRVDAVDAEASTVHLASGEEVRFDRLLLAMGAEPRRLTVPGSELDGIHYLRTVADADTIHAAVSAGCPSWSSARAGSAAKLPRRPGSSGPTVTMVDPLSVPLERVLGTEIGAVYRDLHREHGVDLHLGVGVEALEGAGRVERVRLSDGTVVAAGAVVAGIGVLPKSGLGEQAGLAIDNGIVTDAYLATSAPGVYAAGDVANAWHPAYGAHIRLEHWSSALNQGPAAARNMLGLATAYEKVPYFYSDQYDFGMEYRGWAPRYDQVVLRGDAART